VVEDKSSIINPVKNQVRELDPMRLLVYDTARRDYQAFASYREDVDGRIAGLPRSICLSKCMTARSRKMFSVLGHDIAS